MRSVARLVRSSLREFAACLSAQIGTIKILQIDLNRAIARSRRWFCFQDRLKIIVIYCNLLYLSNGDRP
ncbi:MAG: hypothetical protein D6680_06175 [Cyanobacteria bacterium J007]|nr:MAG: hypothetical protein D6680_06175 [Cyanobacteria bacterium J007]